MSIDWWTVGLQIVNFLVLVWLLKRFLWEPARRVLENRRLREREALEAAKRMQEEAARRQQELEARLAALERERAELRAQLRSEVEQERQKLLEQARVESARLLEEARRRLARERQQALDAVRQQVAELAVTFARRMFAPLAGPALDEAFFHRLVLHLRELPPEEKRRVDQALMGDAASVELASASVPDAVRDHLYRSELEALLPAGARLSLVHVPELVAGVELRLPHARMAFNLEDLLRRVQEELIDERAAEG